MYAITIKGLKAHYAAASRNFKAYALKQLGEWENPSAVDWDATGKRYLELLDEAIKEAEFDLGQVEKNLKGRSPELTKATERELAKKMSSRIRRDSPVWIKMR